MPDARRAASGDAPDATRTTHDTGLVAGSSSSSVAVAGAGAAHGRESRVLPVSTPDALVAERASITLPPDTVDVWAFSLDAPPSALAWCARQLSQDELARAQRFVHASDRDTYIVSHALTRHLLGRYCGVPGQALRFAFGPSGKPSLVSPADGGCAFNLSHSGGRALLAVCAGRDIGADVERRRDDVDPLEIARSCFFGPEHDAIVQAAPSERHDTFFRYWVAKEAVLKGEGIGLGFPLDRFQVSFHDGGVATVTSFDPGQLSDDWTIRMLPCDAGWFAAVAWRAQDWTVRYHPLGGGVEPSVELDVAPGLTSSQRHDPLGDGLRRGVLR